MKELTDVLSPNEKAFAKKAGLTYLKVLKTMGTFFLLGLILTGAVLATSQPEAATFELQSGESFHTARFFGEAGDVAQFGFGITQENGVDYQYNQGEYYNDYTDRYYTEHVDDPWELLAYMDNMEWLVQMQVEYSENLAFDSIEVVEDVSGEINFVSLELYKDGFYRIKITNLSDSTLTIASAKAEINLVLLGAAIVSWVMFGLCVAAFSLMVHIGFWILFIFIILKALSIIQENNKREYEPVIEPRTY